MRIKRTWLAVPAALALALTACGGGSGDQSGNGGESGAAASGGIVEVNGSEPQNPLIPANTNETGGGRLLDVLFAGLTYYDETGASH
ncbi:MAG: ABC transporter substrate-binding protein, partial [Actinomyces sp.]|nr:ABC transporter substrate-binding protein [Actinomyces sp.]